MYGTSENIFYKHVYKETELYNVRTMSGDLIGVVAGKVETKFIQIIAVVADRCFSFFLRASYHRRYFISLIISEKCARQKLLRKGKICTKR